MIIITRSIVDNIFNFNIIYIIEYPLQVYGHEAVARLEVGRATAGVEVACTAENELSALPVTSNHRTLGVKCKQTR